ncbi:hypothetical protein CF327_g7791 [Tilletia walkeri]|nr:hypothetical protein CF327_g7791 [Tilletia walkeri]
MSSTSQLFQGASRLRPVLNSTGIIVPAVQPSSSRLPCSSAQCLRRTYASATSPPPSTRSSDHFTMFTLK